VDRTCTIIAGRGKRNAENTDWGLEFLHEKTGPWRKPQASLSRVTRRCAIKKEEKRDHGRRLKSGGPAKATFLQNAC